MGWKAQPQRQACPRTGHPAGADSYGRENHSPFPCYLSQYHCRLKDHQTLSTGKKMKNGKGLLNPEVLSTVWWPKPSFLSFTAPASTDQSNYFVENMSNNLCQEPKTERKLPQAPIQATAVTKHRQIGLSKYWEMCHHGPVNPGEENTLLPGRLVWEVRTPEQGDTGSPTNPNPDYTFASQCSVLSPHQRAPPPQGKLGQELADPPGVPDFLNKLSDPEEAWTTPVLSFFICRWESPPPAPSSSERGEGTIIWKL